MPPRLNDPNSPDARSKLAHGSHSDVDQGIEIFPSRWQNIVSACLKTVAAITFVWLATIAYPANSTFAILCGIAALLLSLNSVVQLRNAIRRRPALRLTPNELVDLRHGLRVAWSRIRQVVLVEKTLNQIVQYELCLDVISDDKSTFSQKIPVDLLEVEPEAVLRLVQEKVQSRSAAA